MYSVVFNKKVEKFFQKHRWEKVLTELKKSVNILRIDPFSNNLDIKKLQWETNRYRLRIWKYRFLYEISEEKITIYFYDAWSRWDIY